MDTLHKVLDGLLAQLPNDLLVSLVQRKLDENGVRLSPRQTADLQRKLRAPEISDFSMEIRGPSAAGKVHIEITEKEAEEIFSEVQKVYESFPERIHVLVGEIAIALRKAFTKQWNKQRNIDNRVDAQFRKRLHERWREPLDSLHTLILLATEIGSETTKRLRLKKDYSKPFVLEVQSGLHARACQIANEVLVLVSHGYADGALARWRTLHEVAVVSMFVDQDEELAERYLLHEHIDSHKSATHFQEHAAKLGEKPLSDREIATMQETVDALVERFGRAFLRDYGWAADRLRGQPPNFTSIEFAACVSHFRPSFRLASNYIHANAKGAFFKLGMIDQDGPLLAGASNYGLADPGQNAAISLCQATAPLALLDPTIDSLVYLRIMSDITDEACTQFVEVQKEMEKEHQSGSQV